MKYIISASILTLVSVSSVVNALPGAYSSDYSNDYQVTPSFTSVNFDCGYNVDNWVIEAGFGTPSQKAKLLIDSTFDNTFVAGVMCHSDFCENQSGNLYNAGQSSTSVLISRGQTFDLTEGRSVYGDIYNDTVTVGDAVFHDSMFGKAISVEGFPSHANYAGVFGLNPLPFSSAPTESKSTLGYNSTEVISYNYSNILQKRNTVVEVPVGSREVNKDTTEKPPSFKKTGKTKRRNNGKTCTFTFGIDYSVISSVAWLNLPTCDYGKSPFWKTDLDCVKINGVVDFKFKNTIAEFDTTVKDILVPLNDFKKIHQGLKAKYDSNSKKYAFECCEAKDLKVSFADYIVTIPVESWTYKVGSYGDYCIAKIDVSKTEEAPASRWRFGTDFMENFYTIFDPIRNQTGLALTHKQDKSLVTRK